MKASTLEYPYQVIAYLEEPQLGLPVGPPWRAHVTAKRRFKLQPGIDQKMLIGVLQSTTAELAPVDLLLGREMPLGEDNIVVEVLNASDWKNLNMSLVHALHDIVETRDPQFEGENATPHLTTNFRGDTVVRSEEFIGRRFKISSLWLVKEHQTGATSAVAIQRFELGKVDTKVE